MHFGNHFLRPNIRSSWIHFKLGSSSQVLKVLAFVALLFTFPTWISLKLLLKFVEFKWEKLIILCLLKNAKNFVNVTRELFRYVHTLYWFLYSIFYMAATSHGKLCFSKSKVKFCWIWTLSWRKISPISASFKKIN